MKYVVIILSVLVILAIYAFIIRPFLVNYYSRIQASVWKEVLFKKDTKNKKETKVN